MAFNAGLGCWLQPPFAQRLQSFGPAEAGITVVDADTGAGQDTKGLGAAVAGDQGIDASTQQQLGRLDTSALGGVKVLLVLDNLHLATVVINEQKTGGATETAIDRSGEILAGGA